MLTYLIRSQRCPQWQCSVAGSGTILAGFYNTGTGAPENGRVAYASLRREETFILACLRSTEAACFLVRNCENNRQLIVAGIQRFVQYVYTARFHLKQTRKTLCALRVYTKTVIGGFFVHGNGNRFACLTH